MYRWTLLIQAFRSPRDLPVTESTGVRSGWLDECCISAAHNWSVRNRFGVLSGILATGLAGQVLAQTCDPDFAPQQTYAAGNEPRSVVLVDLDDDGDADMAVANLNSNSVRVLLNDGNGTFVFQKDYAAGSLPTSLARADFDGDGDADLVVANFSNSVVSVLLNNGDGSFAAPQTYAAGNAQQGVAVSDLDGDGIADIAVTHLGDQVSVLLNNGDGTFAPRSVYSTGAFPINVALADLDGDGDADMAVANRNSDDVSVLLNSGDGTFAPQQTYAAGDEPGRLALADLDGDGHEDIAVTNRSSGDVSVLLNNGNGTYAPRQAYAAGAGTRAVTLADLNSDNATDIVVANGDSDDVSVLLNNGDGTFAPQQVFGTGSGPISVAIRDLDGDGDADMIVANALSNDVSVLRNEIATLWLDQSIVFTNPSNWADGAVPSSTTSPCVAVFDSTLASFGPLSIALLQADLSFSTWRQANEQFVLIMNGQNLGLAGGLILGTTQGSGAPLPPSGPALTLDNTSTSSPTVFTSQNTTIGANGPATLEIVAESGELRFDVPNDFIVGAGGTGNVVVPSGAAGVSITYGDKGDELFIVGASADGSIDLARGSLSSNASVDSLILGSDANVVGSVRIDGSAAASPSDGTWNHSGDSMTVGLDGRGVIELLNGAILTTSINSNITLAASPSSSARVVASGAGSRWDVGFTSLRGGQGEVEIVVEDGGVISGFSIINASNSTIRGNGIVASTFFPLYNLGTIDPSSPTGGPNIASTLTIDGNYEQFNEPSDPQQSGRVIVEVFDAGGTPTSDRLVVTGNAELVGGLVVEAQDGFDPTLDNEFHVIEAASIESPFTVALMPGLPSGKFMRLNYLTDPGRGTSSAVVTVDLLANLLGFGDPESQSISGVPTAIAVGDLDSKNGDDIAATLPADQPGEQGSVVVLLNNGDGTFAGPQFITVGVDPSAITLGRLVDSSSLDIAVTNEADGTVSVLFNDGTGSFTPQQTIFVGTAPSGIVSGEFVAKGTVDLAIVNAGDDNLRILANDGAGQFTPQTPIPVGSEPLAIATSDLDNDGNPDLVVANGRDDTAQLLFYGGGGFFFPGLVIPVGDRPNAIDIDDLEFNKDLGPRRSVVVINRDSDELSIIRGNGTGAFSPAVNLPLGGSPRSLAGWDMEGDGDVDLAVAVIDPEIGRVVRILRNDSSKDEDQLVFAPADDVAENENPLLIDSGSITGNDTEDLITLSADTTVTAGLGGPERGDQSILRVRRGIGSCPGDATADGQINLADLNLVLANFGQDTTEGDTNGDGSVNLQDLNAVLAAFGTACR